MSDLSLKDQINIYQHHLSFYKHFWFKQEPLFVGLHTIAICNVIDQAIKDFDNGKSTFAIITVPPRHGKSDVISRYLVAHFIGTHKDKDVILATYNSDLAMGLSRDARNIVKDEDYKQIFNRELSRESSSVESWKLQGGQGTVTASGLLSGITGKGGHLLVLDDYCASRADAESATMRNKTWESFTNDFMTRRAPTCICIILATQWHVDDIIGRIKDLNNPESEKYDPKFPKFKLLSFPAQDGEVYVEIKKGTVSHVKYDYLFTDKEVDGVQIQGRFDNDYYEQQHAILGDYGYSALYMCNPTIRGGNMLNVSNITFHSTLEEFPKIKYYRVWDLAHSQKQREKDDPDWTSGTLLGFRNVNGVEELWIKDVQRIRENATTRDKLIEATMIKDGSGVTVGVENTLDAKDAVAILQGIAKGRYIVKGISIREDKVARMSYLEPIFDGGNVHILKANWNLDWLNEAREFPSGKHDDQMDNLSAGYKLAHQTHGMIIGGVSGV